MGILDTLRNEGEKVNDWFEGPSGSDGGGSDVPGPRLDDVGSSVADSLSESINFAGGGSSKPDGSGDSDDVRTDGEPNEGTKYGQEGDDYYGQSTLEQRDSPTLGNPLEGEGSDFAGEGSWMDFDKEMDGAGARYDRDTDWKVDAALNFDTETVNELTSETIDFTEQEEELFSNPFQGTNYIVNDNSPSGGEDGSDTTETGQDEHNRTRPQPGGGGGPKATGGPKPGLINGYENDTPGQTNPDIVSGDGPTGGGGGGSSSSGTWQSGSESGESGGGGGPPLLLIGGALAAVGGGAYYYYYMM